MCIRDRNITQGFSAAFESALPSIYPLDLLVGIVGAVIIRLIVYVKGKNAKKYRKGAEYGSCLLYTSAIKGIGYGSAFFLCEFITIEFVI